MATYDNDPNNPLDIAANKMLGATGTGATPSPFPADNPIQPDNVRQTNITRGEIDPDNPADRAQIDKVMMKQNENKLLAMNGDVPMSAESWLQQAWENLWRNYQNRVDNAIDVDKKYRFVADNANYLQKGNEIAEEIRLEKKNPVGANNYNAGRGIPPRV